MDYPWLGWEQQPDEPSEEDVENRENREQPQARLLKPAVVAGMFGIDRRTLLNWSKAGKIRPALHTAGGHGRYDEGVVLSLLAELRSAA